MLALGSPDDTVMVADPGIRRLVELRFAQVLDGEAYDPDRHGRFVVVEPGDTAGALEATIGIDVLSDAFGEVRFGDPEFAPAAEVIEDHGAFYEIAFVLSDDGPALALFVPRVDGVDPELLVMCAEHAVPATETSEP